MTDRKVCTRCGQSKLLDDYEPQKGGRFGVTSQCRDCRREARRERSIANRCSVRGCGRRSYIDGLCGSHHARRAEYGSPTAGGPIRSYTREGGSGA